MSVLASTSKDVRLLMFMRMVRMMAFGQTSLILALFLKELGVEEKLIGVFMTSTLLGDVLISYFVTLYADRLGRRNVLIGGAALMTTSGLVFAWSSNYYVLVLASIIGVISPGGNEIGPFRAVEESSLAHLLPLEERADVYAWYALLGSLGMALGSLSGGWLIETSRRQLGAGVLESYRYLFALYSIMGVIKLTATSLLTKRVELEPESIQVDNTNTNDDTRPLLERAQSGDNRNAAPKPKWAVLPPLSPESRKIVVLLSWLFAMDSFASSMASFSWLTYYIAKKFSASINEGQLGTIFFVTGVIASVATLGGSAISRRLGPLLTMVITHLPSSTLLALIPLPSSLTFTLVILIARSCTSSMDIAPRQSFLSAVVLKEERTAVMGWVNVVKTLAQAFGTLVTGDLTGKGMQWLAFVIAGSLKVAYDLGILATFINVKLHEH